MGRTGKNKQKLDFKDATVTQIIEYKNTMYPIGTRVKIANSPLCKCCVMVILPDRVKPQGFYEKNRFILSPVIDKLSVK
jgi:hypothetical protein